MKFSYLVSVVILLSFFTAHAQTSCNRKAVQSAKAIAEINFPGEEVNLVNEKKLESRKTEGHFTYYDYYISLVDNREHASSAAGFFVSARSFKNKTCEVLKVEMEY